MVTDTDLIEAKANRDHVRHLIITEIRKMNLLTNDLEALLTADTLATQKLLEVLQGGAQ